VTAAANRQAATPLRFTGALRFITKKRQENPQEAVLKRPQNVARPARRFPLDRAGTVISVNDISQYPTTQFCLSSASFAIEMAAIRMWSPRPVFEGNLK
jgi:hypothetical protein